MENYNTQSPITPSKKASWPIYIFIVVFMLLVGAIVAFYIVHLSKADKIEQAQNATDESAADIDSKNYPPLEKHLEEKRDIDAIMATMARHRTAFNRLPADNVLSSDERGSCSNILHTTKIDCEVSKDNYWRADGIFWIEDIGTPVMISGHRSSDLLIVSPETKLTAELNFSPSGTPVNELKINLADIAFSWNWRRKILIIKNMQCKKNYLKRDKIQTEAVRLMGSLLEESEGGIETYSYAILNAVFYDENNKYIEDGLLYCRDSA